VALVASLGCAALALLAWGAFDPELSRADGGDGFQLVERTSFVRALGIEVFLGVDGASLPLVVMCAVAAPCGVLASWGERRNPSVFFACYMLLVGASLGALVALDSALFFGCLALALTAAFLLVGLYDQKDGTRAASRMLVVCGVGLALAFVALGALHAVKSRAFLVDGSPIAHTWAFPELARIDYVGTRALLFGVPLAKCAFALSFVGLAICAGLFPFHVWLAPVLRSAPPAASMMVCVGFTRAAMLGLLRFVVVLPESARWAAPTVCVIGAAGALYGAAVALGDRDLVGVATFGLVSLSGIALAGMASLTSQALLGAVGGIAASGCAAAAAMITLGAIRERVGTVDVRQIRGLAIEAPLLACALGIAALGVGGVPGSASFWATCLVGLGAVVREPGVATAVLVGAVLLAASQSMPMIRAVRGRLPEPLRRGASLTPYGGHVPDLRPRELAALAPLLLLIVLLGFYPAPLLGRASTTVRDITDLITPKGWTQID
jgi:NADH-quinone oxidoreductase subunit M